MPLTQDRLYTLALAGQDYQRKFDALTRAIHERAKAIVEEGGNAEAAFWALTELLRSAAYLPTPESAATIREELTRYALTHKRNERNARKKREQRDALREDDEKWLNTVPRELMFPDESRANYAATKVSLEAPVNANKPDSYYADNATRDDLATLPRISVDKINDS